MIDASRICVLDFETTGFQQNAPVSLALVFYENGKRMYAKYMLINPEAKIEPGAFKVHGISQEEAEEHPAFPVVWKEIQQYIENSIVVAHNAKYDVDKVLIPTLRRYNIPVPTIVKLCTVDNAKVIVPGLKDYKLGTLTKYFEFPYEGHHTASYDTMMCQRIFARLYKLAPEKLFTVTVKGDYDPGKKTEDDEWLDF